MKYIRADLDLYNLTNLGCTDILTHLVYFAFCTFCYWYILSMILILYILL